MKPSINIIIKDLVISTNRKNAKKTKKPGISIITKNPGTSRANLKKLDKLSINKVKNFLLKLQMEIELAIK